MVLSECIKKYTKARGVPHSKSADEHMITVNEAAGVIAFYYEKIRTIVDYQDEHLLRQNAIRRILNRRFILQHDRDDISEGLVKELVRSRYFPNHSIPHKAFKDVQFIIERFSDIVQSLKKRRICSDKDIDWLFWVASCMIDEHLSPMTSEEALVTLMYDILEPQSDTQYGKIDDQQRSIQLYIAAYRVLLRPDVNRLRYFLLKKVHPSWVSHEEIDPEKLASEYVQVRKNIEALIRHPLNKKIIPAFRRFRIPFIVLHTIVKSNGPELLEKPEALEQEARRICEGLYAVQKRRLYTRTIRAFVYVFLTKMLLGIAIELPYDLFTLHAINTIPLFVNVFFPPLLLVCITLTVRYPKEENTNAIWQAIQEIIYEGTPRQIFVQQRYAEGKKRYVLKTVFTLLYLVLFGVSFGAVAWVLRQLQFNIASGVIFFIFFCLITFFGITLRRSVRDLIILKTKANLLMVFIDSFFLPIMQVGRWLSFNISRINIFVFLFDILIEVPLQALIEITEEWFTFIKEKKDQLE